jgi:two-component system NtrC family sensor kinase
MLQSLAQRVVLAVTIVVLVVSAVSGVIAARGEERHMLKVVVEGADQLSRGITRAAWNAMLADRRDDAYQVMATIAHNEGIDRIRLFNRQGEVTYSTRPQDSNIRVGKDGEACLPCHRRETPAETLSLEERLRIYRAADGRRTLALITPIYNERSCSDAACHAHPEPMKVVGVLDVHLKLDTVDLELAQMQTRSIARVSVEIACISALLLFFFHRFVTHPIKKLVHATQAISRMELDRPLELVDNSKEIGTLTQAFESMRVDLKQARDEITGFTQQLETKVEERTRELQAAQNKLVQAERLASLGQLSASVAHEINNPVSGVLNLAMLMRRILTADGVPPNRLADFRRYLDQVIGETTRVGQIVSDLLAFSRRRKPQRALASLNKVVQATLPLVKHKLRLANVTVEQALDPALPLTPCDCSQLQQVLLNLLLNAAESMQAQGQGTLRIATRVSPAGSEAQLIVSDTGEGIPPDHLKQIFTPFFTTKPENKGVGLGLAVSYGIVQAHGGEIVVESAVGRGTAFTISLPLAPAEPLPEETAHKA